MIPVSGGLFARMVAEGLIEPNGEWTLSGSERIGTALERTIPWEAVIDDEPPEPSESGPREVR